jgi:hypothetical protein
MPYTVYQELLDHIHQLDVIDTHEHLTPEAARLEGYGDFFTVAMIHYASSDIISAGMPQSDMERLRDAKIPFDEKIAIFMPYWEKSENTTYCRVLKISANDLYGIDRIDGKTLPELNRRMLEKNKPGLYKEIMQEKGRITCCLWDQFHTDTPEKDDFFRLALRLDNIVYVNGTEDIKGLEQKYHISIENPEALEEILEIAITAHKPRGLTAIKSALAYQRTLDYVPVSKPEATLSMDKILRNRFTESDAKVLQDYLMFSLAQKCSWHDIPMQVHTGLLEGNGNYIRHANPALLSALFIQNPHTRFDVFHGGYPYGGEMAALAKMFPNVYLDMCWTHIISQEYSIRYLSEWLDTVPVNKILGFGGDYMFVEGTYGHLRIAQENIARTLAGKIEDGIYSMANAKRYAAMILSENAEELFKLT